MALSSSSSFFFSPSTLAKRTASARALVLPCCVLCLVSLDHITANASSASPSTALAPGGQDSCSSHGEWWWGLEESCAAGGAIDIVGGRREVDEGRRDGMGGRMDGEEEEEEEEEEALALMDDVSASFHCIKLFVPSVIDESDISLFPPLNLLSPSSSFILYEDCLLQVPNRFEDPEQLQVRGRVGGCRGRVLGDAGERVCVWVWV